MSESTVRYRHYVGGVLTDVTTAILSDPLAAYGVKRNDTDAVVVADGQAMTKDATGTYSWTFTDPANDLEYTAYVEVVYNGETDHIERVFEGPTTTSTTSDVEWTATTLTAQIRGELDMDPDAAGGTIPNRLLNIVKEAGIELWRKYDWRYKLAVATLTTAVGDADYDPETDFHEISQRWLKESTDSTGLIFTENPIVYQMEYDRNPDRDNGTPRVALVSQASGSSHDWEFLLEPPPIAIRAYRYWYSRLDPWAASDLSDSSVPVWPLTFSLGWHHNALWQAEKKFKGDKSWIASKAIFDDWLADQIRENDETMSMKGLEPTFRGYDDFSRPDQNYNPTSVLL